MRAATANLLSPVNFFDALMRHSPALMNGMGKRLGEPEALRARVPATRFNAVLGPHRMFDATAHPLADISAMRKLVPGATLTGHQPSSIATVRHQIGERFGW
jgi:hypothetical protein